MNKREKIIKLSTVLNLDNVVKSFYLSMIESANGILEETEFAQLSTFFKGKLIPSILEDLYDIIDNKIDEETIDQLLDFYQSKLGLTLLEKTESINKSIKDLASTKWSDLLADGITSMGIEAHYIDEKIDDIPINDSES
jgi:hypothetical protein